VNRRPVLAVAAPVLAWLKVAAEPAVARRALRYAIIVGAVLIVINHSDAIAHGDIDPGRLLRMALTVFVPYAVSTASSVGAIREARRAAVVSPSSPQPAAP
jgi:hypothetical protein